MKNRTVKDCRGCISDKELSLHGGDMPSTYICTSSKLCIGLSQYLKPKDKDPMSIFKNFSEEYIAEMSACPHNGLVYYNYFFKDGIERKGMYCSICKEMLDYIPQY